LLAAPRFVLSVIGTEYVSGEILLFILASGILPFAIATNTISRFNYLADSRKVLSIGLIQITGFIVGFILLVPVFESVGAAFAILISYSVSCIPALVWSEKVLLRHVANTAIAVIAGFAISIMCRLLLSDTVVTEFVIVAASILSTTTLIFALKITSISEVRTLVKSVINTAT
jgi:O-antigen/teichoic acid export membrane protein